MTQNKHTSKTYWALLFGSIGFVCSNQRNRFGIFGHFNCSFFLSSSVFFFVLSIALMKYININTKSNLIYLPQINLVSKYPINFFMFTFYLFILSNNFHFSKKFMRINVRLISWLSGF